MCKQLHWFTGQLNTVWWVSGFRSANEATVIQQRHEEEKYPPHHFVQFLWCHTAGSASFTTACCAFRYPSSWCVQGPKTEPQESCVFALSCDDVTTEADRLTFTSWRGEPERTTRTHHIEGRRRSLRYDGVILHNQSAGSAAERLWRIIDKASVHFLLSKSLFFKIKADWNRNQVCASVRQNQGRSATYQSCIRSSITDQLLINYWLISNQSCFTHSKPSRCFGFLSKINHFKCRRRSDSSFLEAV